MDKALKANNLNSLIKNDNEIVLIEKAAQVVAETISLIEKYIKPGVETLELDNIAEDYIRSKNGKPSFKGYEVDKKFFPNTLCISVNEEIIHGLPGHRKLVEGDIVSIDCGCELDGYHGDSAYTFPVGQIFSKASSVVLTKKCRAEVG